MMLRTARHLRRFSSKAQPPKDAPAEYPSSFVGHAKKQRNNVFNISMAFLALSLSTQLVAHRQTNKEIKEEKAKLERRVETLENTILTLGHALPPEEDAEEESAIVQDQVQTPVESSEEPKESNNKKMLL